MGPARGRWRPNGWLREFVRGRSLHHVGCEGGWGADPACHGTPSDAVSRRPTASGRQVVGRPTRPGVRPGSSSDRTARWVRVDQASRQRRGPGCPSSAAFGAEVPRHFGVLVPRGELAGTQGLRASDGLRWLVAASRGWAAGPLDRRPTGPRGFVRWRRPCSWRSRWLLSWLSLVQQRGHPGRGRVSRGTPE